MQLSLTNTKGDVEQHGIIDLQGVGKIYATEAAEVVALQDIELQVLPGEFLSVMGPSGSGKSTLMNILGLLDRPSNGRFLFDGEDIGGKGDNYLARLRREKMGFIFQSFNLFPRSNALANVAMPLLYAGVSGRERNGRAQEMLEQVGLGDRMYHRPVQLSGGQQQRVAIARALVNNPVLILADEPTGNLDSKTGASILAFLQELNDRGATIVMVTHDERVASHTKRIIRLMDGRIIDDTRLDAPLRAVAVAGIEPGATTT